MPPLLFRSTNEESPAVNLREAMLAGQAPDRGLYLPETFPRFTAGEIAAFTSLPYHEIAFRVLSRYTGAYALNETPGQPTATVVKVRRHYATASEVKPVVEKLQQAVNENRPVTFDLEP